MYSIARALVALTLALGLNLVSHAQFGGGGSSIFPDLGDIQSQYNSHDLDVLGDDLVGDHTDVDTGALSLTQLDVSIPGNSALPVEFGRMRSRKGFRGSWLGDWVPNIPYMSRNILPDYSPNPDRCTGQLFPAPIFVASSPTNFEILPEQWFDGYHIYVPGRDPGTASEMLNGGGSPEFSGTGATMVTKNNWTVECLSFNPYGGEGYLATAPNGDTYKFEFIQTYFVRTGDATAVDQYTIEEEVLYVTEIRDVHNNWVKYDYTGGRLAKIWANDGREITFGYTSNKISSVSANGRSWSYDYDAGGDLEEVTLPDGRSWVIDAGTHALDPWITAICAFHNSTSVPSATITHPSGTTVTFDFTVILNGRTYMDIVLAAAGQSPPDLDDCYVGTVPGRNSATGFYSFAVTKKTMVVPSGGTYIWTRDYEQDYGTWTDTTPQLADTKERTITNPLGHKTVVYVNRRNSPTEGTITKTEIIPSGSSTPIRTVENEYSTGNIIGKELAGRHFGGMSNNSKTTRIYQTQAETTQEGVTYTTDYTFQTSPSASDFAYNQPKSMSEYSTLPGGTRTTNYTYINYSAPWILALPDTTTLNGKQLERHTYNSSTGKRLTTKTMGSSFNTAAYQYNSDGTLKRATNALGDYVDYGSSYKRGIAQSITLPDFESASRIVDNNGWVTSFTDPRGNTTGYSYNTVGWLTNINRPGSWADTTVSYTGLGNGLIQVIINGNMRSTIWMDGLHRVTLSKSDDLTGNDSSRHVKTTYDALSRPTFSSLPSHSFTPSTGVNTTYDALGRVTQTAENVAPFATVSTNYLNGNKIRVTDPSGAQTTTTYRAFGAPATEETTEVVDASGSITTISRDVYGKIENINQSSTQGGHSINLDRQFWYDSRFRLCRHGAPEFGDELFSYDDADQLIRSSRGESSGSSCSTPSSSLRTTFTYDEMGRQTLINFPAGTDDIVKTYDENGNETRNARGGIIWDYAYTELNAISQEKLAIDGNTFTFNYTRDQNGYVSTRSSPSGLVYGFDPNGFGEPTQLSAGGTNHLNNVTYHPNGMVAAGAYGNGQTFSQTLTARQQPLRAISQKPGGYKATDLQYTYEVRGKVASITDHAQTGYNQAFVYNPMGRLLTASGNWGTGRFKYDGAGNIREKRLGTRYVQMAYNTNNQIDWVVDTANPTRTFMHDARGNVTDDGRYDYVYDFANQPTSVDIGPATLPSEFDGNLKRVKNTFRNGSGALRTVYTAYSRVSGTPIYRLYSTGLTFEFPEDIGPLSVWFLNGNFHSYRHLDHLGSILAATNSAGNSSSYREQYSPFGERLIGASNHNNPSYTGHARDLNTNLYYMQARLYDPIVGRFLSTDPLGYQDQINQYAYVGNDPINTVDPDGMQRRPSRGARSRTGRLSFTGPGVRVRYERAEREFQRLHEARGGGPVARPGGRRIITMRDVRTLERSNDIIRRELNPSGDTLRPGPFARDSIPARGPGRNFTRAERDAINGLGRRDGCHTCGTREPGTKRGNFVPDHQPPTSLVQPGQTQRLFPQCAGCSARQGGQASQASKNRGNSEIRTGTRIRKDETDG